MLETYELMKRAGPRPDSETCFILVKGCVDSRRPDLAELVVKEFEAGGVRVRAGTKLYIVQNRVVVDSDVGGGGGGSSSNAGEPHQQQQMSAN